MKRLYFIIASLITLLAGTSACWAWIYEPKKR
ncbi:MAG: cyclic lactone autoinducer peptide [Firmicutes bacterium]|nr:cyclic lactone autoinducer peptide [Bacillota bacterium]